MLAGVADQEHAIVGAEPSKELAHLVGAGEARFIDKVEMSPVGAARCLGGARKKPCRVPASNSGLAELASRSGGGREALHLVALRFGGAANVERSVVLPAGEALDALDAVGRAKDILNDGFLRAIEMGVPVGDRDGLARVATG